MFVLNRLVFLIFILMVSVFNNISNADYKVETVYFMPTDSEDKSDELDLNGIMKSIQSTYEFEMNRHGFHGKTFQLETDKNGKVVVHKVRGDKNKLFYNTVDTLSIVQDELEIKGYDNRQSIYAIVMAGMDSLNGGTAAGLAVAYPFGAWFNNSEYYGYYVVVDGTKQETERILRHELAHTFGLSHIVLHDSNGFIMANGTKLAFNEARWLSRNQYFSRKWMHNFGPEIVKFHGAENQNDGKIRVTADISDPDGLFQAYGFVTTPRPEGFATVGFNFYDGNVHEKIVFDDIDRNLLTKSNEIWIQLMDIHGNWRYHHPSIYELPDAINKNEDLGVVEDNTPVITDCPGCEPDINEGCA